MSSESGCGKPFRDSIWVGCFLGIYPCESRSQSLPISSISHFNTLLNSCFNETSIIPVPMKDKMTGLNDYWPVALTLSIIKCFERFVMSNTCTSLPKNPETFQVVSGNNRSMENTISLAYIQAHPQNLQPPSVTGIWNFWPADLSQSITFLPPWPSTLVPLRVACS